MLLSFLSVVVLLYALFLATRNYIHEKSEHDSEFSIFLDSIEKSTNKDFEGSSISINKSQYFILKPKDLEHKRKCIAFIHGFPDTLMTWHAQLILFKQLGYLPFSFGLKGYYSDTLAGGPAHFDVSDIAQDYVDLMASFDYTCNEWHLVGHDWGAIIGRIMLPLAERKDLPLVSFTSEAIADLSNFFHSVLMNPVQLLNQWHFLAFQFPILPELWLTNGGLASVLKVWNGVQSESHHQHVVNTLTKNPAALKSAMHYYRRNATPLSGTYRSYLIDLIRDPVSSSMPTLYVAGVNDHASSVKLFAAAAKQSNVRVKLIDKCGHYPHLEQQKEFNNILLVHIGNNERPLLH